MSWSKDEFLESDGNPKKFPIFLQNIGPSNSKCGNSWIGMCRKGYSERMFFDIMQTKLPKVLLKHLQH